MIFDKNIFFTNKRVENASKPAKNASKSKENVSKPAKNASKNKISHSLQRMQSEEIDHTGSVFQKEPYRYTNIMYS